MARKERVTIEQYRDALDQAAHEKELTGEDSSATWIHERIEDPSYMRGYKILPSCRCSACGGYSNSPRPVCPSCGRRMIR